MSYILPCNKALIHLFGRLRRRAKTGIIGEKQALLTRCKGGPEQMPITRDLLVNNQARYKYEKNIRA